MSSVTYVGYRAVEADRPQKPSYYQAYTMIRNITGVGEGNGPFIAFHDGFAGLSRWGGFLSGADRIALDQHPYFAFSSSAIDPPSVFARRACERFGPTNTR